MTDWRRVLRFGLAGGANTLLTLAVFALLVRAQVPYPAANGAAWITGLVIGFLFGKVFVFRDRRQPVHRSKKQFLAFTGVYVVGFLLSTGLLAVLVESGTLAPVPAQFIVIPVIAAFNFVSSRYLVFVPDAVR